MILERTVLYDSLQKGLERIDLHLERKGDDLETGEVYAGSDRWNPTACPRKIESEGKKALPVCLASIVEVNDETYVTKIAAHSWGHYVLDIVMPNVKTVYESLPEVELVTL